MRTDNIGLFWQDHPVTRTRGEVIRPQPPIPETGWKPPTSFPNLSGAAAIALDVETYDPELIENGPGWARGKGHIVGVSIGVVNGGRWYFPVRHTIEPEDNMPPEKVFAWLRVALSNPNQPKVGANLLYDIGWLLEEDVQVKGKLYDVQFAEALLTEDSNIALDTLAEKYLDSHKETSLLYQWCSDFYGGPVSGKQRANIYRTPPRLSGPYAESDVDLPLLILPKQFKLLKEEDLLALFDKENRLIPLLIAMRKKGVNINIEKAEIVHEKLGVEIKAQQANLDKMANRKVNINIKNDLVKAFDLLDLTYNMTKPTKNFPKGQPSFTKGFLESNEHPFCQKIVEIRQLEKMQTTFIESYLLNSHIDGRVYGQFHPLRGEEKGTRSGRFSSSNPNLQNIPSRDLVFAPLLRGLFIPDEGHKQWRKFDLSQIEYRMLAHFAVGEGAHELRAAYSNDPRTDYHVLTQNLVHEKTGVELGRKPTKTINFGFIYGMGISTLAKSLNLNNKQARGLFDAYHSGAPFAHATMEKYIEEALSFGCVSTILNRKSRFDYFEPAGWGGGEGRQPALKYEWALKKYGPNIQRAYAHKALNRVLQGSAADYMKEVMLQCYETGVFDETGVPALTVHDELDFSDPGGKDEAFKEVKRIFEHAIKLKVPVQADEEIGADWGHVKEVV